MSHSKSHAFNIEKDLRPSLSTSSSLKIKCLFVSESSGTLIILLDFMQSCIIELKDLDSYSSYLAFSTYL